MKYMKMMKSKEYIFEIEEENSDYAEVFYGWIRNHSRELIRCRDCKHRTHNKTCIKNMKRKPDEGYCDEGEVKQY